MHTVLRAHEGGHHGHGTNDVREGDRGDGSAAGAIARTLYDGFNARDLNKGAAFVADDCEWLDIPSGAIFRGPKGYLDYEKAWLGAFPDGKVEIVNVVSHGDMVVTEFIGRGTHDGPLSAPSGEAIAPTGNKAELRCIDVLQVRDGKITRARSYYDSATLLRQLSVK